MAKKIDVIEIPVVDPMAERAKLKAEIDGVVAGKIAGVIKVFHDEREKDLAELASLNQSLKSLEDKKSKLVAEKVSLTSGIHGIGVKGVFDLDLKLRSLEREIKSFEGQVEKVFSRLTEIPKLDFPFLNFLSRWKP